MGLPQPTKKLTPQEYYRLERESPIKHEYYDGEIYAMSGGSARHSLISSNITRAVGNRLLDKPCSAYDSNMRLKVRATGLRTYPDVSVYCGEMEFDEEDDRVETAVNPLVLFEVLSKSTEAYDRGAKADNYRRIDSLRAYILVSQIAPHIEIFERQTNGPWTFAEAKELGGSLTIAAIQVALPLSEVYHRVQFPPPQSPLSYRE